ncbi:MAG: NADH-quinone oxidoreductase subunit L [Acidimicrobiia bacterium]|nr:NADH-quinone oxidoreductase subunit L [Acidimicrobiia bacterium]
MVELVWLIPALPLAGFVVLVVAGRRLGEPAAGWLATLAVSGSFVAALITFAGLASRPAVERFYIQTLFEWIPVGNFSVDVGFLVDPLSMTMTLFVTGIAALIHLYSIGYMHGDADFSRFFVYLNLFVFSMLMLVLGDNLLLTFLGWEGVGACSYLLISFWFTNPANASAGKKAFVTNRVGDFGFMLAMFLLWTTIGSIRYADVLTTASSMAAVTATAVTLLLLVGAAGKSAQLPLFVWLPDAMAGPTPVSALIHAATMVTAGVYLLVRMNPVIAASYDWAPYVIAWVGALTALFAATAAVAQNDIKKVLAYSTISQLGYLFLAVGVGGYVPAIFHMVTHAFFKALLFLGSGSVIHGMHHEQDMRRYGGLYKLLPVTAATFIVGWLAIAGVPPFAGFWSKDEILAVAWNLPGAQGKVLWAIGLVTAILTAFYMSRQVFMTFFGRYRFGEPDAEEIAAGWDAKLAAAEAAASEADGSVEAARAEVETALASRSETEAALVAARAASDEAAAAAAAVPATELEAAQAALDAAGDDRKAKKEAQNRLKELEKPVKDADKAAKAATKAAEAVDKVTVSIGEAEARVEELVGAAASARSLVEQVRAEARAKKPTSSLVPLFSVADSSDVEDFLPAEVEHRRHHTPHESPALMTVPLLVLSIGAIGAGALNLPFASSTKFLEHWLEPSLFGHEVHLGLSGPHKVLLAVVAVLGGLIGILAAAQTYLRGAIRREGIEAPILAKAWGIDGAYAAVAGGPGTQGFEAVAAFDRRVVDGSVMGIGRLVAMVSALVRRAQTGLVRSYALGVTFGVVLLLVLFLTKATY